MSCTHEQNDLLDWLDGALSEAEAARVQARVQSCESCRAEWEALRDAMAWADGQLPLADDGATAGDAAAMAGGFVLETPPSRMHTNLMRAAQAQLEGRDPVDAISGAEGMPARTSEGPQRGATASFAQRLWDFLTGLNTGGLALATASAMALVAATSWWMQEKEAQHEALAFPQTQAPGAAPEGSNALAESESAPAAPTAVPARPTDDLQIGAPVEAEVAIAPAEAPAPSSDREGAARPSRSAKRPRASANGNVAAPPTREASRKRRSRAVTESSEANGALEGLAAAPELAEAAGASVAPAASNAGGGRGQLATGLGPDTGALRVERDKSADMIGTGAIRGRASRAPTRSTVAPAPAPASRAANLETAAQKILGLARAARSQGACARAIPLYRRLVESNTYRDTPTGKDGQVALELAACYASTGRTAEAARTVRLAQSRQGIRDAALLASVQRDLAAQLAAEARREAAPAEAAEAAADVAE